MYRLAKLFVAGTVLVVGMVGQIHAQQGDGVVPRIVNGLFTSDFPTTGALLLGGNPDTADTWCSGTMAGCATFLTAAHCVCQTVGANCQGANAPDPGDYTVYLQHAGLFAIESITVHPSFVFPVADVAVVKLVSPVDGIAPTPINSTKSPPFGTSGTIAGFGRSGGSNFDYGLKRFGNIETAACPPRISNTTSVCWRFQNPLGPPGTDSGTCNADSGGPLFIDFGDGDVLAGITSGGNSFNCLPTDQSFDTNVFFYRTWIQSVSGSDIDNTACGTLPQVGEPETNIISFQDTVSISGPEGRHSVIVPENTTVLRIAMNAEDDGSQDFNLFVKAGSAPTEIDADCTRIGPNQFAFCEFDFPISGEWHTLVQRAAGAGAYQVTVTTFGESSTGTLSVDLSSTVNMISPGVQFPFTLQIINDTNANRMFGLSMGMRVPGATDPVVLISPRPIMLPANGTFTISPAITLPVMAPLGTYAIGANIFEPGGSTIDVDVISFGVE